MAKAKRTSASHSPSMVKLFKLFFTGIIVLGIVAGFTYYFLANILTSSKAASPYNTIAKKNACYEKAYGNSHGGKACTTFASKKVNGVWTYPSEDNACKGAYDNCFYGKAYGSGGRGRSGKSNGGSEPAKPICNYGDDDCYINNGLQLPQ